MKRAAIYWLTVVLSATAAHSCLAQPVEGRQGPGRGLGFGGPRHPLLMLLDEDRDGVLSAAEIDKAAAVLKKLDRNGDGKIAADELPRFPMGPGPGGGGPAGPGGGQLLDRLLQLDRSGDGKLTKEELPERMQGMFSGADENGDGALDKEELKKLAARWPGARGGPAETGRGGFLQRMLELDKNGDGKINKDEVQGNERARAVFERLDADGDGVLTKEELQKAAEQFSAGARGR